MEERIRFTQGFSPHKSLREGPGIFVIFETKFILLVEGVPLDRCRARQHRTRRQVHIIDDGRARPKL
ncbi:hypothetical protein M407DRAFT_244383 [Tulasnella calospora MUT 4182]|uniref:Uncharacterized protein n=1 Tax=Tulasnella calospora MUT 4182 TaxID=1051891 RepID=A0A0C3LT72_9AGAM|nr:hypothetical protein M407DRAFT_244383 [Tulasnella calospora MUT 4182]